MSDFSERPFVAGSLIGLRAFSVDRLGRLIGPTVPQVFTPGENEATCRKGPGLITFGPGGFIGPGPLSRVVFGFDPGKTEPPAEEAPPKEHQLAGVDCTCGFYAYVDGRNDYKNPDRVAGIIEGYGVCTVGSRGFRASKAKLVALIEPHRRFPVDRLARVLHNYPDVPVYPNKQVATYAHPLTVVDVPTPETVDDFWTREA